MTKTYRYRLAGPSLVKFRKQCVISPTVVAKDVWTIDIEFDDGSKPDVDEFMSNEGYEFVEEVLP